MRSPCTEKPRGTRVPMGPAGCNRPCEILDSGLAGDSKTSDLGCLSLACSWVRHSPIPTLQPTLASSQDDAHDVPPGQAQHGPETPNPPSHSATAAIHNTQVLFPLSDYFLVCGESTQMVPLTGKIPLAKPRIKLRETPSLQRDTRRCCATSLPQTRTHIYSRAVLGRGNPVFSPKH